MEPGTLFGSALDLVGAIIWLVAVLVMAIVLILKGGGPRLGGLRLVGGGMILYALAGLLGDVLTLRSILNWLMYGFGPTVYGLYTGGGEILGALVDAGVLVLVVMGLAKVATDLAAGRS